MLTVLGMLLLAPGSSWAQSVEWTQRIVSGPSSRYGHAMACDSDRGVTVLFGGQGTGGGSNNLRGDTWEWNGTTWSPRANGGPVARTNVAMAYDSVRHVTVLFGGGDGAAGGVSYGDTWEWNGSTWSNRAVVGPSPRGAHAMAFDSTRGVTVLFGGVGAARYGDTWEWNGTTWSQGPVGGPQPSPRGGHAMAFDSVRGVVVLFGGNDGIAPLNNQTWERNGTVWIQRNVTGPTPREGPAMAYDAARRMTVLFGGYLGGNNTNFDGQTWDWNGAIWTERVVPGPSRRFIPAMSYDTARRKCVLFGGFTADNAVSGETWELRINCAACPADLNCDGTVNSQDFFAFLGFFFGNLPEADFNHDGTITSQDFFDFLAAFFAGC